MDSSIVPSALSLLLLFLVPLGCARFEPGRKKPATMLALGVFSLHAVTLGPLASGEHFVMFFLVALVNLLARVALVRDDARPFPVATAALAQASLGHRIFTFPLVLALVAPREPGPMTLALAVFATLGVSLKLRSLQGLFAGLLLASLVLVRPLLAARQAELALALLVGVHVLAFLVLTRRFVPPTSRFIAGILVVCLLGVGARSLSGLAAFARDPEARFAIDRALTGASPAAMRRLAFVRLERGTPERGVALVIAAAAYDAEELTHLASYAEAAALSGDCPSTRRALAALETNAPRIEPFAREVVAGYVAEATSLCAR